MNMDASPSGDRAFVPTGSSPSVSPVPASIPGAVVTEIPGEHVTVFRVRDGWEWGNIYVRPFGEGAEVVVHSTFGTFGYAWIAMGGDWREFLPSCDRHYAMNKLAGPAYEVSLDCNEFVAAMLGAVDEYEASILEEWDVLAPDQEARIRECREVLGDEWGWEDVHIDAFFWHFNQRTNGAVYAMELYETKMTKVNPQVIGFWDTIWTPFTQALAARGQSND